MRSVLFVCTANVCRSPMAMAIFSRLIQEDSEEWRVESAGTRAIEGVPVAQKTQAILKQNGIDLGSYYSRPVNSELVHSSDLILTMEQGQKEALVIEFPEAANRIFSISEMVGLKYDVPDPMGKSLADFQATYNEIERTLKLGIEKIRRLAQ